LDGSAKLPVLMNSVLILAGADCFGVSLVTASCGHSRTTNMRRPTRTALPAIAELTTLSLASRHSGLRGHLLDPRSTDRQMQVQGRGRTPDLLRHLPRRHVARGQHGAGYPDLDIIQRPQSRSATCSGLRLRPLQTDACLICCIAILTPLGACEGVEVLHLPTSHHGTVHALGYDSARPQAIDLQSRPMGVTSWV
jgi:hypothetical protein